MLDRFKAILREELPRIDEEWAHMPERHNEEIVDRLARRLAAAATTAKGREGMYLEWYEEKPGGDIVFSGRISMTDLEEIQFGTVDRATAFSPATTAADFLQSAQLLFFRMQQQTEAEARAQEATHGR